MGRNRPGKAPAAILYGGLHREARVQAAGRSSISSRIIEMFFVDAGVLCVAKDLRTPAWLLCCING